MSDNEILLWATDDQYKYKLQDALRKYPYRANVEDYTVSLSLLLFLY